MSRSPELGRWLALGALGTGPLWAGLALAAFLALLGGRALLDLGWALGGGHWAPHAGNFGVWPLVAGTVAAALLALALALPVGLAAAVYLALYAGAATRRACDVVIGLLGSVPSVVIGLWGMTWVVPRFGNSLASAALVLAVMITPTFALLAGAALRQVPAKLVETARALPVGEAAVARVLLGHARRGVLAAALLATSRAIGEAVAISMVAGNVPGWPARLAQPISTLTTTLIVDYDGASGVHRQALLFLVALTVALIAVANLPRFQRTTEVAP
jgi:phosphate transport system permease protein